MAKYRPCQSCGGRMTSMGDGRIRCVVCRKSATARSHMDVVPDGHLVKGLSMLVDADGDIRQQWVKTQQAQVSKSEALKKALAELPSTIPVRKTKSAKSAPAPRRDLLSVYPIGDAHLGLLCWGEETGEDYDLAIAEKRLTAAMDHLVSQGEPTKHALVANLGDYFHSDNNAAVTPKSQNSLDVDTRWAKVLRIGLRAMVTLVETALSVHETVRVINENGNHDIHTSAMLSVALDAYYRNEPRVSIDMSPAKFHYLRFGRNLIGVTHGDTTKAADLESIMATDRAEDWGITDHRYWLTGHLHHIKRQEFRGCIQETFRTLAPKDAWHSGHGYRSGSEMVKLQLHESHGEVYRATCSARLVSGE